MKSLPWTAEEDAKVRDMWEASHSPAQIARELGRTQAAVTTRVHRKGLKRPARS